MADPEIEVSTVETMWVNQGYEAINIRSKAQMEKLISDLREAAKELGWKDGQP